MHIHEATRMPEVCSSKQNSSSLAGRHQRNHHAALLLLLLLLIFDQEIPLVAQKLQKKITKFVR